MLSYKNFINKIDQLEESNILICSLELKIFSVLKKKSMSAYQIANITKTKVEGIEVLLNALTTMGALKFNRNLYKNTSITYKYFCESSPDFKKGTVMLKLDGREEYSNLLQTIKKGRDLKKFDGSDDPKFRTLFTYAMHERSELYADQIASLVTKNKIGKLIDIGAGSGSYSAAILKKDKSATATLIDREAAIKVACELHKKKSIYKRLKFINGDFFSDDFGIGYDTAFLSNIIHIYNINENKFIFKKINKSLVNGGRIILYDFFLKDSRTEPYNAALFAITMLLYTKTGKSYSYSEINSLLKKTGFSYIKKTKIGHGLSIIEALKS
jgi:ubiquinone/menaquinone biosynthesis C-methylase UbiE